VQRRLEELRTMRHDYDRLALMTGRASTNLESFLTAYAALGSVLKSLARTETITWLADSLDAVADGLVALQEHSEGLMAALVHLHGVFATFKDRAIEDAERSAAKYEEAQRAVDAASEATEMLHETSRHNTAM